MNILIFEKIQYDRQFYNIHEFLNYNLPYLGKYLTNFIKIWHMYSTCRELLKQIFQFLVKSNMAANFAVFMNFKITIFNISESI